ncbi:hypothetical protein JCM10213_000516 [Rhodosporidiobolus nylandii]
MSGPGQGYNYGHYAPQQPHQQPASSLFGASDGGAGGGGHDPFAQMGGNAGQGQYGQQQQGYPSHEHGMNTVYEEDEPASSPEVGRNDPHWGGQQPGYGGGYDQSQYGGYGQQQGSFDYGQQGQGAYDYAPSSASAHGSHQQQPAQEQQFDVPVYPGWIYNPSTNSYDPDPHYQQESGASESAQDSSASTAAGQEAQGGYAGYEEQGQGDYGEQYGQQEQVAAEQGQGQASFGGYDQPSAGDAASAGQGDPYAADPYANDGYDDPYANDAYSQQADAYGSQAQAADPYAPAGAKEDAYAVDSNPYQAASEHQDPYAAASQPPASSDPYAPPPQQQPPSQQAQQQAYNPYAPPAAPAADNRQSSFSPPPSAQQQARHSNAYAPPPAQQYSSFASAYEQPQPQPQNASYDPYAPAAAQQQRQRSDTATSSVSAYNPYQAVPQEQQQPRERSDTVTSSASVFDPYAPRAQQQQRERSDTFTSSASVIDRYAANAAQSGEYGHSAQASQPQQAAFDPYNPRSQPPQSQVPPLSPPVKHAPLARAPQQQPSFRDLASPPPVSRSAFSPPPRSTSAASNASSRRAPPQAAAANSAQAQQMYGMPPQRSTSAASSREPAQQQHQPPPPAQAAAPPPKGAGPPSRGGALPRGGAPPFQRQSAGAAFDIPPPRQQPAQRAPPRQQPPPQAAAAPQPEQAPPPRASEYAPAPAAPQRDSFAAPPAPSAPAQPVLPPSQRKPPPFAGGVLQPPVRRAPHQRGPSAFAGDSPYGPSDGPLTSAYEPPRDILEEEEEEEEEQKVKKEEPEEDVKMEEEEKEFVPSWMQRTSEPPAGPYYPTKAPEPPRQPQQAPPTQAAAPPFRAPQQHQQPMQDVADDLQKMSLDDRAPPPPRGGPAPPPQRAPQQTAGAPPPRIGLGAPPPSRAQPPPQGPAGGAPPPPRGAPPPRAQPPPQQRPQPPQQQQQYQQPPPPQQQRPQPPQAPVPQLHVEAASPNVRAQDRYSEYDYGRSTPQPIMGGIEEEQEEEAEHSDYFGDARQPQSATDESVAYGAESSQGTGEEGTGATTPSSAYGGDWKADSADTQGYDYINRDHPQPAQQKPYAPYAPGQKQPHDPYAPPAPAPHDPYAPSSAAPPAPRDIPSRDLTSTPPAQKRLPPGTGQLYASPSRFGEPGAKPPVSPSAAMARANSYGAATPTASTDSYAAYPSQGVPSGPYSARADGNLTAPAAYGSFAQQAPYSPQQGDYAPAAPALSRQASFAGEPADLGLERRTAPVVSFGFGGRMVVVFPRGGQPSYGIDAANPYGAQTGASATPSTVHIRKLADMLPPPSSNEGAAPFPGPIFLDGGKANAGKKRKEAVAWVQQRLAELEQEKGHWSENKEERRKVETKALLYKLVLVMIENEGRLTGSPKVDDAVRAIFAPDAASSAADDAALPTADQLASAASQQQQRIGSETPFVSYHVSPAHLDQMSAFLLRGERREAVRFALDNKLWAHAFIIASCVDTDCWKDVTIEFLRSELTPGAEGTTSGNEGREALRVAYSMFAGLGAESIHQFVPPRALGPQTLLPAAPVGNGAPASAPLSRNPTGDAQPLSEETLEKWQDTVGMIVANRTAGDAAALTALGDALAANGWVAAAHVCYLLSPQTSLATGLGTPGSRIVLLGSTPFLPDGGIDLESVKLTELVEFALSLTPTIKGHEPFAGFPHLQAFRLYHAAVLAEQDRVAQALKYTEAIVNTLKLATKPSPFYHPGLVAQIKALSERLGTAPGQEKGGSWIARKVPRPTVNSLWSTFEGGFNKFVSGEEEPSPQQLAAKAEVVKTANGAPLGPFSHYSSISPGSTSGTLSRAQSSTDLVSQNHLQPIVPPVRPLSATGPTSPLATNPPNNAPHPSPGPPPVKRAPYKGHHARSSSLGAFAGYDYNPNAPPPWQQYAPPSGRPSAVDNAEVAEAGLTASPKQERLEEASARRPQFAAVEEDFQEDASGFISPMAQFTPSVSPAPPQARGTAQQTQTHRRMTTAEELADLGIGNSKSKRPAFDTLDEELEAEEGGVTPTRETPQSGTPSNGEGAPTAGPSAAGSAGPQGDKPAIKPSKSWLGGWFKREASPANQGPGPIKAKLGEEKSFYYDEKLKRWVNKGSKGAEETPAAIVPPPRAATASPSRAMRNGPPRFMSETPPLPPMPPRSSTMGPPPLSRSATSADLRAPPPPSSGPPSRPPSASGAARPPARGGASSKRKPQYAIAPL